MDIIARDSGGSNIVAREAAAPHWYAAPSAPAAYARVWWSYEGEPASAARALPGTFTPGGQFNFDFTPDRDRYVRLYVISYAADGTPSVSRLEDAQQVTVLFRRDTTAPVVGQVGDATADNVTVGVAISRFTRKVRLKVAETLTGGGALVDPTVKEFDAESGFTTQLIDIERKRLLRAHLSYAGDDR
jgi:hypothetical protein